MRFPFDAKALKIWFQSNKRDFPWREDPAPYAVWVSEIMLQQTRASVVIPYFERWMKRFPTLQSLAEASLDEVIKEWEGLGYYSRARNLHAGAKYILEHFQGIFPDKEEELKKIKGLGLYTIGAILSFAYHQKMPAVDGNAARVLSRCFALPEDISKGKTLAKLRSIASMILEEENEPWIISEALIELGATVCRKKADCLQCPLKKKCRAFQESSVEKYPFKSSKVKIEYLFRAAAVIHCKGHLLIKREEGGKVMSDLHEFPYFEIEDRGWNLAEAEAYINDKLDVKAKAEKSFSEISHSFTRYQVKLYPFLLHADEITPVMGFSWKSIEELKSLAFSSGHRKLFQSFLSELASASFKYL